MHLNQILYGLKVKNAWVIIFGQKSPKRAKVVRNTVVAVVAESEE